MNKRLKRVEAMARSNRPEMQSKTKSLAITMDPNNPTIPVPLPLLILLISHKAMVSPTGLEIASKFGASKSVVLVLFLSITTSYNVEGLLSPVKPPLALLLEPIFSILTTIIDIRNGNITVTTTLRLKRILSSIKSSSPRG